MRATCRRGWIFRGNFNGWFRYWTPFRIRRTPCNGELTKREPLKYAAVGLVTIGDATIGKWSVPTPRHRASRVRTLNGCMDELIVVGQALDDQEVRRIYDIGRP